MTESLETTYNRLLQYNSYGERPVDDVVEIVYYIEEFCKSRRVFIAIPTQKLVKSILEYISFRQTVRAELVSTPHTPMVYPVDWNSDHERIWNDWLTMECSPEQWDTEVMTHVFGTGSRTWETPCEGWRNELRLFLPWWITRNFEVISKYMDLDEYVPQYSTTE